MKLTLFTFAILIAAAACNLTTYMSDDKKDGNNFLVNKDGKDGYKGQPWGNNNWMGSHPTKGRNMMNKYHKNGKYNHGSKSKQDSSCSESYQYNKGGKRYMNRYNRVYRNYGRRYNRGHYNYNRNDSCSTDSYDSKDNKGMRYRRHGRNYRNKGGKGMSNEYNKDDKKDDKNDDKKPVAPVADKKPVVIAPVAVAAVVANNNKVNVENNGKRDEYNKEDNGYMNRGGNNGGMFRSG